MSTQRTIDEWLAERGMSHAELLLASALESRVVEAISQGRYTPSPEQRQRISTALGVPVDQIVWGHKVSVEHMYGHGPQFGRSP